MKATILNQQQTTRTNTTLVLALLATMFTTFAFAGEKTEQDKSETNLTEVITVSGNLKKREVSLDEDINKMDSIAIYGEIIKAELVNTILENEMIIESDAEINPVLGFGKTIEETISEDNQVIESNLDGNTYPLDFNRINKMEHTNKQADNKNRIFTQNTIKS